MSATLAGVAPVAPVPFAENGDLDVDGVRRVLDCMVDQGVDGICILANYSEQFLLSDAERDTVLDASLATLVEESLPAMTREVADVTGAGDTVVAVLALALGAGAKLAEAARLANMAASVAVTRFGPASVTADDLRNLTTL